MGALFTKVICTFLKSVQKYGFFDAPFDLFKEKKFSSLRRENELFWELKKVKNGRNRSNFRKTVFYKQILDFHCPSKILCHTSNLWNFVKIIGPYYLSDWRGFLGPKKKKIVGLLVFNSLASMYSLVTEPIRTAHQIIFSAGALKL